MITRLVEELLRGQDSCVVLHSWTLGVTLLSYTAYVVANAEAFHETVAKELLVLYTTAAGGQGAEERRTIDLKAPLILNTG